MITTTHELKCTYCDKIEVYIDSYPHNKPEKWYSLQPNLRHSQWMTSDFSGSGDFCSLECILGGVTKVIEDRDNPVVGGDLSTGGIIRLDNVDFTFAGPTDDE